MNKYGGKKMKFDEIKTSELIESYKKIEEFINFLEKEEKSNAQ